MANGKSVALTLFAPLGTKDFSPYIAQLKDAKVDAIWVAEVSDDAIAFVKQAQEFALIPTTRLLGHALIMNFVVNATGKALLGTQGTTEYSATIDNPRNRAFVSAWQAKFHRMPTDNEGLGYNAMQVMFGGVGKAASVEPHAIAKALEGSQIDSLFGPVLMRGADHQLLLPSYVARVKNINGLLEPVIKEVFPPTITPAPSALCKM